ncbi:MAG: HD domain-containing protein [Sedimentisphaerales bacterium]|nr:HD domain-containing protein [Sedimentisphaerales bacterium]
MEMDINKRSLCCQAGYLPVPLGCVPVESLSGLEIYLATGDGYSLYSAVDLDFNKDDSQRLLNSGVEFVYVSVRDHKVYYRTMENALQNIIADPKIKEEKKNEILYATAMELSNQLLTIPPGKKEVERAVNLARATVQLIMKDKNAFQRLYEAFNHDFYTSTHLVNVCGMTISVAQKMGLTDMNILQNLGTGGLLHDIGKIFIPHEVLNNPGALSPDQFEFMKTHVDRGFEHLTKVMELTAETQAIILEHHERMDGSGYPRGLHHDQLSSLGRLAGIVDTFDAMTSVRPYRSHTFSVAEALQQIEDDAPAKFDSEIVHAFASMVQNIIPVDESEKTKTSPSCKEKQSVTMDASGPIHTQYYFRIPVVLQRLHKIKDKLILGPQEKVIAHKISCLSLGLLSDRPFELDQNICIVDTKLQSIGLGRLLAVVIRCQDHSDGWYTVDAKFHKPQPPEVIEKLKTITVIREVSHLA